jgi:hypothetical protein
VGLFDGRGCWHRWDKRALVTDYLSLRAHQVAGACAPGQYGWYRWQWRVGDKKTAWIHIEVTPKLGGVHLHYKCSGEPVTPYLVRWEVTTPRYGGWRYWWLCPKCGRRCATLYGGRLFLCRVCHGLTYETAQTGDRLATIDTCLLAIRRRLGAYTGPGWSFGPLPEKPKRMHKTTYTRLWREYANLLELHDLYHMTAVVALFDGEDLLSYSREESEAVRQYARVDYRRDPAHPTSFLLTADAAELEAPPADPIPDPGPERFTLGELATRAGVSFAFAQEAQREGLLRPDAGRTKRAKRYRGKLAAWLTKLYELRAAGLAWADLRAWAARRFTPGHEHERQYPAGYAGAATS